MNTPIMPKATALWLIDNTGLTFEQIANFCGLHQIEVQAMADEQSSTNLRPANPIDNGQLTTSEIKRCENNPAAKLMLNQPYKLNIKLKSVRKYTSVVKRQDRPGAALWLIRNYPRMSDDKIANLSATTKKVVLAIRERTYPNIDELVPKDPVFLGFCTQTQMNAAIKEIVD